LYRGVVRNALPENEVQPYREIDVRLLVLAQNCTESVDLQEPEEDAAPPAEDVDEPPVSSITLAPLLLLNVASEQAAAILAHARQEAEALQRDTYNHAVSIGREEGKETFQNELQSVFTVCDRLQQQLCTLEERFVMNATPELVRLALAIAEKIIGRHVEEDPSLIASVLEQARTHVEHARKVTIWLHPADHDVLLQLRPDLVRVGEEGQRTVAIVTSEDIGRGGCRIETEMGVVDATIPVQLDEIKEQLLHD
jgi:flagellar biosynthesis/type III secretory pathway protein FliH